MFNISLTELKLSKKVKFVHVIKFVKVGELFPERKVRFARAEQQYGLVITPSTL